MWSVFIMWQQPWNFPCWVPKWRVLRTPVWRHCIASAAIFVICYRMKENHDPELCSMWQCNSRSSETSLQLLPQIKIIFFFSPKEPLSPFTQWSWCSSHHMLISFDVNITLTKSKLSPVISFRNIQDIILTALDAGIANLPLPLQMNCFSTTLIQPPPWHTGSLKSLYCLLHPICTLVYISTSSTES